MKQCFPGEDGELTLKQLTEFEIVTPLNRGAKATYFCMKGRVYCLRTVKGDAELLVWCVGPHPVLHIETGYWDRANVTPPV